MTSKIQSIVIDKNKKTLKQALKIASKISNTEKKQLIKVDITKNKYRFRLRNPNKFRYFRNKKINNYLMLVIGFF
jgi:hypothetical protein